MIGTRLARALALAVLAAGAVPAAAAITRGPYLQAITTTSAIVVVRSDTACPALVRYGKGALDREASSASATTHAVKLTGLEAATEYQYAVEVCGTSAGETNRLRTASGPATRSVHFVASGDFASGSDAQAAVGRAIEAVAPELFVAVGDVAYDDGTEAEFNTRLFGIWASLLGDVPMFPIIGNHEYNTAAGAPYFSAFYLPTNNPKGTEKYYSFDWGPVHFVGLDTNCAGTLETADCSVALQKAWLEADLAATTQPWKIAFMHHPTWSSGEHGSSNLARSFTPIFEKYGVDLVLTGHDHNYERSRPMKGTAAVAPGTPGAITYVVAGNGGATLRAFPGAQPAWTAYRNNTDHGFLDVRIEEGVLSAEMRSTTGAVKDAFRIEKELPPVAVEPGPPAPPPATDPAAPGTEPGPVEPGPVVEEPGSPAAPSAPAAPAVPVGGGGDAPTLPENVGGGCGISGGSAGALGLAALVGWALARRRRKRHPRPATRGPGDP
jgi:hypothetical protein